MRNLKPPPKMSLHQSSKVHLHDYNLQKAKAPSSLLIVVCFHAAALLKIDRLGSQLRFQFLFAKRAHCACAVLRTVGVKLMLARTAATKH
mmetsp:Transcript_24962/g.62874  ORF Transcript_24962/g.62874 Transcript_24962/m.62874 type:complete len:90 (+) Transcript_24962:94-363(+)